MFFNHKGAKSLIVILCLCVFVVNAQTTSEADALAAVKRATNPTLKLAAAEDFIARFPNSTARTTVAELVAAELSKVKNGAVALELLERANAVFTSKEEREILKPIAFQAYAMGEKIDEAFALAAEMLSRNPDDLRVLSRITQLGSEEARKRNRKYVEVSLQYGLKAIALVEAGNDAANANLDQLYQQTAILYLSIENTQEAKARLKKASLLSPYDPTNFALLGRVVSGDYNAQMNAYEAMPEGEAKQKARKDLDILLDSVIDAYARAVGLSTGRAEYQTLMQQVVPDLTNYYKHRNNNSLVGLKQLISRYVLNQ